MDLQFDPSRYYPPSRSILPALFSGREAEVEVLKRRIVNEGKRIGLITIAGVLFNNGFGAKG